MWWSGTPLSPDCLTTRGCLPHSKTTVYHVRHWCCTRAASFTHDEVALKNGQEIWRLDTSNATPGSHAEDLCVCFYMSTRLSKSLENMWIKGVFSQSMSRSTSQHWKKAPGIWFALKRHPYNMHNDELQSIKNPAHIRYKQSSFVS